MAFFSKKKMYDTEKTEDIGHSEKELAINDLERRRRDINSQVEDILVSYSKLTKNKSLRGKNADRKNAPNVWQAPDDK